MKLSEVPQNIKMFGSSQPCAFLLFRSKVLSEYLRILGDFFFNVNSFFKEFLALHPDDNRQNLVYPKKSVIIFELDFWINSSDASICLVSKYISRLFVAFSVPEIWTI